MKLTPETTRKIAKLSLLKLTENEIQVFTPQLSSVLDYVESLSTISVKDVEPLYSPTFDPVNNLVNTPLREDVIVEFNDPSSDEPKTLSAAPQTQDRGYRVPPILEGE